MAQEQVSKVRLVRCPKCRNLLPELPHLSLYQCGACSTVLRAKKEVSSSSRDVDGSALDKPENERDGEGLLKLEEVGVPNNVIAGDTGRIRPENGELSSSSPSMNNNWNSGDTYRRPLEYSVSMYRNEDDAKAKWPQSVDSAGGGGGSIGFGVPLRSRASDDRRRILTSAYSPSEERFHYDHSTAPSSSHGNIIGWPNRIARLEQDRAKLLRELDELEEKMSGSHFFDNRRQEMTRSSHDMVSVRPSNGRYVEQYSEFSGDPHSFYPRDKYLHQNPACSCSYCYDKDYHVPSHFPSPTHSNFHHPVSFGKWNNTSPGSNYSRFPHSRDLHVHFRQGDVDSVTDGFRRIHPIRRVMAIAGGAPFITCHSCFESLQLPRKLELKSTNRQKLRCGACSAIFILEIENMRLVITDSLEDKETEPKPNEGSHEVPRQIISTSSANGFNSAEFEGNISESNEKQAHVSKSSSSSDEVGSQNLDNSHFRGNYNDFSLDHEITMDVGQNSSRQTEQEKITVDNISFKQISLAVDVKEASEVEVDPQNLHGSHLRGNSDDISLDHEISVRVEQNTSEQTQVDKIAFDNVSSKDRSSNGDIQEASEVEHSFDYQVSVDTIKEHDWSGTNKWSGPNFVSQIKKSFLDLSSPIHRKMNDKPKVFVNGQPIPDHLVKQAERLAGPIHPGDYWYDSLAGFWGVMGQPCSGIIPPNIKEFSYPMPTNCAAGSTRIFVNGRELHQNDLDMLARKGLPTTEERFYTIEFSGRVFGEDSGQVLNLGRLAPTVDKLKHGFGMEVPEF